MIYGYINNNTKIKNIDNEEILLRDLYPDISIYIEIENNTTLNNLLNKLKEGESIVMFDLLELYPQKIDKDYDKEKLIRNIDNTYQNIFNQGINLEFIDQPELNSINYRQAIMDHISYNNTAVIAAISSLLSTQIKLSVIKSISNISENTKPEKKYLKKGMRKGTNIITQKEKTSKEYMKIHLMELGGDMTNPEIIKNLRISKNTFFKYKRELLIEAGKYNMMDIRDDYAEKEEIKEQVKRPRGRPRKKKAETNEIPGQMTFYDFI